MGNSTSFRRHLETAEKTGCFQLSHASMKEVPRRLIDISHLLRTLDLSYNRIQVLEDIIKSFTALKVLTLNNNKIEKLSDELGNLIKLEQLKLANNLLMYIPTSLSNLENLKSIDLSFNKFTVFPHVLCHLKNVQVIDLSNNEITKFPEDIGKSVAHEINLNKNKIDALVDDIAKCINLKTLRLDNNRVDVKSITRPILADSKLSLLSVENNPFSLKQLQDRDGYELYIQRYTSTKKKLL